MLKKKGVRQHFVLGGDGTQKGAHQTYEKMQEIGWECAVVGVPKTIDNDINLLERQLRGEIGRNRRIQDDLRQSRSISAHS